jgi:effector-binding domain-containing protein
MEIERIERSRQPIVGLHEVVPMSNLSEFFGRAFAAAVAELARQGTAPMGPPVALYNGTFGESADVTAGFPVRTPAAPEGGLVLAALPGGEVVQTVHVGPYDELAATYGELSGWIAERGLTPADQMWEEYLVGPDREPDPARWRTRVAFPVA